MSDAVMPSVYLPHSQNERRAGRQIPKPFGHIRMVPPEVIEPSACSFYSLAVAASIAFRVPKAMSSSSAGVASFLMRFAR